jgi:SAM-dependent methyltransferase
MSQYVVQFGKVGAQPEPDGRLDAPACHRNHKPIWSVLGEFLKGRPGHVLEVGSGTGQHVVEFARQSPHISWWPSDLNEKHLRSIAAWRAYTQLANVKEPVRIDLLEDGWRLRELGVPTELLAIFCANVLHIAPWPVAEGLMSGAARYLASDGRLFIYGPFMREGKHTAASNAEFDASLRDANPEWGVRDVGDLSALAASVNLKLADIAEMPANNVILIFERTSKP